MFYSVHDAARAIALGRVSPVRNPLLLVIARHVLTDRLWLQVTLGGEDQEDEEEAGGLVEVKVDARP